MAGLMDVFSKEDRVGVTFSDFYKMMKEVAKAEMLMNAVNCNVPHIYIREMVTGVEEKFETRISFEELLETDKKQEDTEDGDYDPLVDDI